MRLCRFSRNNRPQVGLYDDKFVTPLAAAAEAYANATHDKPALPNGDDLLEFLPPDGKAFGATAKIAAWAERNDGGVGAARLSHDSVELLVPIPKPNKLLLLAGNYNEHLK